MPIEQMNISLSPQMAEFIRAKVKNGDYTNISEVVRDAVRRMQRAEALKALDFEAHLTQTQREGIRRRVLRGIEDLEMGRYEDYDADELRTLPKKLATTSARRTSRRRKTK